MSDQRLDLREMAPPERHPRIFDAFEALDSGETLTIVNDHDPKPLYYQMSEEVPSFDAAGYEVERVDDETFVADLPKK